MVLDVVVDVFTYVFDQVGPLEAGLGLWSGRQAGFRVREDVRAMRDRGGAGAPHLTSSLA